MAFYDNFSNETEADDQLLEEDEDDRSTMPSADVNQVNPSHLVIEASSASSSEKDTEDKLEDQVQSDGEAVGSKRPKNGFIGDLVGTRLASQSTGRRTSIVGKWGSSVWRECQAQVAEEGSMSINHLKSMNSECRSEDASDGTLDNRSDHPDSDDIPDSKANGHVKGSDDGISSDEYHEHDAEEQSTSFKNGESNHYSKSNSQHLKKRLGINTHTRNSKYDNSDYDDAEEEDDDNGGDDPDDADFNPEYGGDGGRNTRQESSSDNSDGDEGNDEDFDIAAESDGEYFDNSSNRKRKSGRKLQPSRGLKTSLASNRYKRRRTYDEEESSGKELDDSDEGYGGKKRKVPQISNKYSHQTVSRAKNVSNDREPRTSRRPVRKVSYAESEESEDDSKETAKKSQKIPALQEEADEEDGDTIERVLWHQLKGAMRKCLMNGGSTEPVISSSFLDGDLDWDNIDFFIKWKGQSYLHCQWQSYSDLQHLSGFKKVLNYMKRVNEEKKFRQALSREEAEVHDVGKEMELDLLKEYSQVERVFADRLSRAGSDDETQEYLVKWKGLPYSEATWEQDTDIAFAQGAIDDYKAREAAMTVVGKTVDAQRKKSRASLRKLDRQPEWLKGGSLRDYQLEGLNFLVNSWRNDTNVILADEMGLGKTVQAVSMLGFLQNAQEIHGPFLVVVPLSTITNWAKEFRKWLPEMNVIVYVGNRASREICQQYEFHATKKSGRAIKFNTLLTTYEVVLKDKAVFSTIKWNYLMVDEAHRLKNCEASLYITLSEFSTKNKLLITGTPLQNSVEELWALLHFLDADKFKSREEFVDRYKNLSSFNETELANLHKELRPHLLRRVIKDVEKSLPPKIERILRVEMSPLQKQYYKWILERNFQDLNKGVRGNQVSLLNIVVELKKCCNHPFLFESADHGYLGDANLNDSSKIQRIIMSSGKLVILDKLLVKLKETKHRVLIFSQMVRMLDILADYLSLRGFQFQRLDGSTRADLRHQAMEHFNAPGSDDFCFLLSTRAGGLGINLATADTVIIFDSDWNPQNDLQAMSRAHRIGQQDVVNIYRFVTSKSVEEDILERAKKKMVLDHLVIQKLNEEGRLEKKETKKNSMFDKNELSAILRFGAEELFKENDDESKRKLENMDIDEILERAEKVESKEINAEKGSELLSAFKVANFCNAEDDETFWSRLIQPEVAPQDQDTLAPRAARSNRSYAEDIQTEKVNKRKKKGSELNEKMPKRNNKSVDTSVNFIPAIEGAGAHIRDWVGGNVSKKDANAFVRAVKKYGDRSRISSIVSEVGGLIEASSVNAQIALFEMLIDGCKDVVNGKGETKSSILDFYGVAVKANELLTRSQELHLLSKRIQRYQDPVASFRLRIHLKDPSWSKSCGWNLVDDARLLLGIYLHGYGNWEKIRLDTRLGLTSKIAPAGLPASATLLPRPPSLDARASTLLKKEFEVANDQKAKLPGKQSKQGKMNLLNVSSQEVQARSSTRLSSRPNKDSLNKRTIVEPRVKEEGEISETEEPEKYRRYKEKIDKETKEEKWREWCADVMGDELRTLKRLHKLQTTSSNLPKEEVLAKVRKYLQILGQHIDLIMEEHAESQNNYTRMAARLWNYVSMFSNLPGERLSEIYSKLKEEFPSEARTSSAHLNMSAPSTSGRDHNVNMNSHMVNTFNRSRQSHNLSTSSLDGFHGDQESGSSEAWKRRRRNETNAGTLYAAQQQPLNNRPVDESSKGILGFAPNGIRQLGNSRWNRTFQSEQLPGNQPHPFHPPQLPGNLPRP